MDSNISTLIIINFNSKTFTTSKRGSKAMWDQVNKIRDSDKIFNTSTSQQIDANTLNTHPLRFHVNRPVLQNSTNKSNNNQSSSTSTIYPILRPSFANEGLSIRYRYYMVDVMIICLVVEVSVIEFESIPCCSSQRPSYGRLFDAMAKRNGSICL
ncbi:hypothetical protein HELRODRAFT_164253 [Helobdella robusta]|uniref:Uncharacterized protein n=1 Tax=Helobdella robusta TaxID=6412 RepID=T1EV60_HELRO|nr:hypothetical protein HELRODRAFT_164253 [Helobdella robusta]ESN94415.1 hypothetical protein HELRODRAFT_164253 [Helobdella robusta]